jgi:hypothetical protein
MLIGVAGQVLYPLQFHYAAAVSSESAPGDAVTLEAPAPADLQERFQVVYAGPASAAVKELRWTWQGNQFEPMSEDDARRLRGLSEDPRYLAALDELQRQSSSADSRPAVLPNPRVDADPNPPDYDSILVVVLHDKLPALLHGFGAVFASLVIVAIMAASMSTADSNLHALSAVLTRDVYDQYLRPQASERERVWVGRGLILAATVLSLAAVILGRDPEFSSRYEVMTMIASLGFMAIDFSAQVLPITIDMLFLNRGTGKGAAAGLAAGLFTAFLFGPLFKMLAGSTDVVLLGDCLAWVNAIKGDLLVHGSVWGLAVNVPVFVLVSLVTRGPSEQKLRQYRELLGGGSKRVKS